MFWGIPFNKWHGILAFVIVLLAFAILWWLTSALIVPLTGKIGAFVLLFIAALLIAHHLQCWNEIRQALKPDVEKTYGSWQNFQANSRDDFRWFWLGISVSWIVPLIIVAGS